MKPANPVIVYRVEDKKGKGPYGRNKPLSDFLGNVHGDCAHPGGYRDFGYLNERHLFAFTSMDKLKIWFDGFIELLLNNGYFIVEYEVKKIIEGESKKQCIFNKRHVISKKIIQLDTLPSFV